MKSASRRVDMPTLSAVLGVSVCACLALGIQRGLSGQVTKHSVGLVDTFREMSVPAIVSLFWVPVTIMVWLIGRGGSRRNRLWLQVALFATTLLLEPGWVIVVVGARSSSVPYIVRFAHRLDTNVLLYVTVSAALWASRQLWRDAVTRLLAARRAAAIAEMELDVLTMQLQPHFLFNTLNLISQLVFEDLSMALKILAQLKELLSQSLQHAARREVSLRDELRMASVFLDIQRERFRERLRIVVTVAEDALDASIPALILQPLVENAIRHGIGDRQDGGCIEIEAVRRGPRILLRVTDDGEGLRAGPLREGVGLTNTKLRLELHFAEDFLIEVDSPVTGGTVATIDIPFRPYDRSAGAQPVDEGLPPQALHASDAAREPRHWSRASHYVLAAGAWVLVVLAWTGVRVADLRLQNQVALPLVLLRIIAANVALWLPLMPIALRAARRVRTERRLVPQIPFQVVVGCLVVAAHVVAWFALVHAVSPVGYEGIRENVVEWSIWDIVVYSTILMFCIVSATTTRFGETVVQFAESEARLKRAKVALFRAQLQPSVLFGGLDAVARQATTSAKQTEITISRLGDLLRHLLDDASGDLVSLSEEIATLEMYAVVIGSSSPIIIALETRALKRAQVPRLLFTAPAAALGIEIDQVGVRSVDTRLLIELAFRRTDTSTVHERRGDVESIAESFRAAHGNDYLLEFGAFGQLEQGCVRLNVPYVASADDEDSMIASPATATATAVQSSSQVFSS